MQLVECEKPNAQWIYAFEIITANRTYRLFTDSYDTKQQWVFTILSYLKHRVQPANTQGPVLIDFKQKSNAITTKANSFNTGKAKCIFSSQNFAEA